MNLASKKRIFDPEEKALLDSFEKGEWKSVPQLNSEKKKAKAAAANYFKKDARINIRIAGPDLLKVKQIAAYEGIPYQTFISSVLHKVASGHLSYKG